MDEPQLKPGDAAKDRTIVVETNAQRQQRALDSLAACNWKLPAHYKFDRDEANDGEIVLEHRGKTRGRDTHPMKLAHLPLLLIAAIPGNARAIDCTSTPGLAVDADGAPDSYRLDDRGLSYTCDGVFAVVDGVAHTQKNDKAHWQALCKQYWSEARASGDYSKVKIVGFLKGPDGKPVVQTGDDPLPGEAFVTTTTLTVPGSPASAQRHYVNANEIPYAVLSSDYAATYKLKPGDLVAVYRPKTERIAYAVYGDCCSLGEGSVRLHQDLGSDPIKLDADGTRRAKVGIGDKVVFVALTGAHTTPTLDSAAWRVEIKTKGDAALAAIGGMAAVKACLAGQH